MYFLEVCVDEACYISPEKIREFVSVFLVPKIFRYNQLNLHHHQNINSNINSDENAQKKDANAPEVKEEQDVVEYLLQISTDGYVDMGNLLQRMERRAETMRFFRDEGMNYISSVDDDVDVYLAGDVDVNVNVVADADVFDNNNVADNDTNADVAANADANAGVNFVERAAGMKVKNTLKMHRKEEQEWMHVHPSYGSDGMGWQHHDNTKDRITKTLEYLRFLTTVKLSKDFLCDLTQRRAKYEVFLSQAVGEQQPWGFQRTKRNSSDDVERSREGHHTQQNNDSGDDNSADDNSDDDNADDDGDGDDDNLMIRVMAQLLAEPADERMRRGGVEILCFQYYNEQPTDVIAAAHGGGGGGAMASDEPGGSGGLPATLHYHLPHKNFEFLWDSLFFEEEVGADGGDHDDDDDDSEGNDNCESENCCESEDVKSEKVVDEVKSNKKVVDDVKSELLSCILTSLLFAKHSVNPVVVPYNRLILLHGEPGTGKTSLCRALAQKLSIRMAGSRIALTSASGGAPETNPSSGPTNPSTAPASGFHLGFGLYPDGAQLIEINAHSIFSRWFSESGKIVLKLFETIIQMANAAVNRNTFFFVLIDEVESLCMDRGHCLDAGNEPTDSIRAVNAVLTQIDRIQFVPNMFVLCTSNLKKGLDAAFLDSRSRRSVKPRCSVKPEENVPCCYYR